MASSHIINNSQPVCVRVFVSLATVGRQAGLKRGEAVFLSFYFPKMEKLIN